MPEVEDDEIVGRVRLANLRLRSFRNSDLVASNSYIDSNDNTLTSDDDSNWDSEIAPRYQQDADYPEVVPIGQPNYMAINTEVSIAALCSQIPKLHIRADEKKFPNSPAVIQQAWQQAWENGGFGDEMAAAWQKRKICGLGCIWYRWDENYGFTIENVTSNRFFFDPHTTNLKRMRYAGVGINLPLSEAIRKYDPDEEYGYFAEADADPIDGPSEGAMDRAVQKTKDRLEFPGDQTDGVGGSKERTIIRVWIYFDHDTEAHIYDDRVIYKTDNLLRRIPLLFRAMFKDPRDRILPLGMNVYARGLNQELVWISQMASSTAKHGGSITLFDTNQITGPEAVALQSGSASQLIGTRKPINDKAPPLWRLPADQLSPAWGPARAEVQAALDGIMGASSAMRGETPPGVTATAAMLSESKSNAMQVREQTQYEGFCSDVATAFVMCTQRFGGPEEGRKTPDEAIQLWHSFLSVQSVKVVTGSTSFSNPATELTASMQLFTTIVQSWELWMQLAAKGIVQKVPNMEAIFNDLLIAANRSDTDLYWKPAPPPPQGPSTLPPDLVKWMQSNYLDAPPDIQRQMEQLLGFKPSEAPPPQQQPDNSAHIAVLQAQMEAMKLKHKEGEQQSEHQHDYRMEALKTASQIAVQNHKAATTPKPDENKPVVGRKKPNT